MPEFEKLSQEATQYGQFSEKSQRVTIEDSQNQLNPVGGIRSILDINQNGIDDCTHSKTIIDANLTKFKNL